VELVIVALLLIFAVWITDHLSTKYWLNILRLHQTVPVYWDMEPVCPYCQYKTEAPVGLADDGKWWNVQCPNCELFFKAKPTFTLTHIIKEYKENDGSGTNP